MQPCEHERAGRTDGCDCKHSQHARCEGARILGRLRPVKGHVLIELPTASGTYSMAMFWKKFGATCETYKAAAGG